MMWPEQNVEAIQSFMNVYFQKKENKSFKYR